MMLTTHHIALASLPLLLAAACGGQDVALGKSPDTGGSSATQTSSSGGNLTSASGGSSTGGASSGGATNSGGSGGAAGSGGTTPIGECGNVTVVNGRVEPAESSRVCTQHDDCTLVEPLCNMCCGLAALNTSCLEDYRQQYNEQWDLGNCDPKAVCDCDRVPSEARCFQDRCEPYILCDEGKASTSEGCISCNEAESTVKAAWESRKSEFQSCHVASDCEHVNAQGGEANLCNQLLCGTVINNDKRTEFDAFIRDLKADYCMSFTGSVEACPTAIADCISSEPDCVGGTCVLKPL